MLLKEECKEEDLLCTLVRWRSMRGCTANKAIILVACSGKCAAPGTPNVSKNQGLLSTWLSEARKRAIATCVVQG